MTPETNMAFWHLSPQFPPHLPTPKQYQNPKKVSKEFHRPISISEAEAPPIQGENYFLMGWHFKYPGSFTYTHIPLKVTFTLIFLRYGNIFNGHKLKFRQNHNHNPSHSTIKADSIVAFHAGEWTQFSADTNICPVDFWHPPEQLPSGDISMVCKEGHHSLIKMWDFGRLPLLRPMNKRQRTHQLNPITSLLLERGCLQRGLVDTYFSEARISK